MGNCVKNYFYFFFREEMGRLKIELESCYAEDRAEALQQAQTESLQEIAELTKQFNAKEKELRSEVI